MKKRISGIWRTDLSIYSKLVLLFVAVFIPMYLVAYFVIAWGERHNRAEMADALRNTAAEHLAQIQQELLRLKFYLDQVTVEMAVKLTDFSRTDPNEFDRTEFMLEMRQFADEIRYVSIYIDQVIMIFPEWDIRVWRWSTSAPTLELEDLVSADSNLVVHREGRFFLSNRYTANLPDNQGKKEFLLAVELSPSQLQLFFENVVGYPNGGAMLVGEDWFWDSNSPSGNASGLRNALYGQALAAGAASGWLTDSVVDGKRYVAAYVKSQLSGAIMIVYAPSSEFLYPLEMYRWLFWVMTLLSVSIVLVFIYWIRRILHRPLYKLVESFRSVERGSLDIAIEHSRNDEFRYIYGRFNAMIANLKTLIQEVYQQKITNQQTELKRLQSQINPHFFYNSLFILHRLIDSKRHAMAADFVSHLGHYYEFISRNDTDEITLSEEMRHCRNYLDIQKLFYANRVTVEVEALPEALHRMQVPKLIVQPIAENGFKHAFAETLSGGLLKIQFRQEVGYLIISVADNGERMTEEKAARIRELLSAEHGPAETGSGLRNVHQRVKLRFGEGSGLFIRLASLGGLLVEIKIPQREDAAESGSALPDQNDP